MTEENLPIESATVVVFPSKKYAITDFNGRFRITLSKNDSISYLEVSHVSYEKRRINVTPKNIRSDIQVRLVDAVHQLNEATLVETRLLQKVINTSQSVITVSNDQILDKASGTFSGALTFLPGLNTMNVGVGIAKPMIRGMGFNRILVNNRGIKQEGQQWGADHGLEVDPFDVGEVEIIKGPASLLFGSDGLGGVINIKEEAVLDENGNELAFSSMYQANNGGISNSLGWRARNDQWSYSARITHQDYGDYTVPANEFTYAGFNLPIFENRLKNTSGSELHFSGAVGYRSEHLKSSLKVTSFNQRAGIFTGAIGLPRAYNLQHNGKFRDIDVPRQENHHHMLTNNTTIALGKDRLEMDLGYQRNIREELSFPGAHGISPELAVSNLALGLYLDTYTANLRYALHPRENRQVMFGAQLQYMQNQKDGFEFLLPVFNSTQFGFFHYQFWKIGQKWTMNAGVRYDRGAHGIEQHLQPIYDRGTLQPTGEFSERIPEFDRRFENFSGALGTTLRPHARHLFKLHLGNSFRFPTAIELSSNGVHHGNFRHEVGDPDLNMERGYQIDLTYLYKGKDLFLELATFYGYYTDYIYLAPSGTFSPLASGGTLWQYRQDDALFNGFEITARYQFPFGLKIDLATDFVQNLNLNSRLPLPLTPPAAVVGQFEYGFINNGRKVQDARVFISGRYNFAQNRTDRNERPTPDSFLLDAGIGFALTIFNQNVKCRLSANNLLNTAYFNHISRYRLLNLPEQGRNIMFSLRVPIII